MTFANIFAQHLPARKVALLTRIKKDARSMGKSGVGGKCAPFE